MKKEKCEQCGRFMGSYSAELKEDYAGAKKGDRIDIRGCKYCERFTRE